MVRRYLPRTGTYAAQFPLWSAAANDMYSVTQRLLNPILHGFRDMEKSLAEARQEIHIANIDADRNPYRSWLFKYVDVLDAADISTFMDDFSSAIGTIEDVDIPIREVNTIYELLESAPTAYRVAYDIGSGTNNVDLIDIISGYTFENCESTIDGNIQIITSPAGNNYPRQHISVQLPASYVGRYGDEDLTVNQTEDPGFVTVRETYEVNTGDKVLLPWHVVSGTFSISDVTGGAERGLLNSNSYIIHDGREYNVDIYSPLVDFDDNGIIDGTEVAAIQDRLGTAITDVEPEVWESQYARYDIANEDGIAGRGDGRISHAELGLVNRLSGSIARSADIVEFLSGGSFRIIARVPNEGETISYYKQGTGLLPARDGTVGGRYNTLFGGEYRDISYEEEFNLWYCLPTFGNRIDVIKFDQLSQIADKLSLPLPIQNTNTVFKSLTIDNDNLYVLGVMSGGSYIYHMDLNQANPAQSVKQIPIHSGEMVSGYTEVYKRDNAGLDAPRGIGSLGEHKLVVVEDHNIKIIMPMLDYMIRAVNPQGESTVQFMENYESYQTVPSGTIDPVYFYIWNIFDEYALFAGLTRLPGESNSELRKRTLRVWTDLPGRSPQGVVNTLAHELGELAPTVEHEKLNILPTQILPENISGTVLKLDDVELEWNNIRIDPVVESNEILGYQYHFDRNGVPLMEIDINTVRPRNVVAGAIQKERYVIYETLESANILSKSLVLPDNLPDDTEVEVVGAGTQQKDVDYYLDGNTIKWDGKNWDGILQVNDVLKIMYWKVIS